MKNFTRFGNLKKIMFALFFQLVFIGGIAQIPVTSGGTGQTSEDPHDGANGGSASGLGCGGGGANYYGGSGGAGLYGGGGGGAAGFGNVNMIGGAGGQGVLVVAFYNGAAYLNSTVYTSGSSLAIGPIVTSVKVWAIGAGGGGAGSTDYDGNVGGGGGAGGIAYITMAVLPGDIITYTLGSGGNGGDDAVNGSPGSNTSAIVAGITITGNGGSGGEFNNGTDAAGGAYSGGDGGSNGGDGKGSSGDTGGGGGGGIGGAIGGTPGSDGGNGTDANDVSGLFAALSGGSILPITWKSFIVTNQNETVMLQWQTAYEQNTINFTIQHSTDGIHFKNIDVVAAAGNSDNGKMYQYLHQSPPSGISYYRLFVTEISGKNNFSSMVKNSRYEAREKDLILLSNPVTNGNVRFRLNKNAIVTLLSLDGKQVYRKNLDKGLRNIDVSNLVKGNYIIQAGTESQKILIQ